jgi:hypothetical protein
MEMSARFSYLILKEADHVHPVSCPSLPENHSFPLQQAAVVTRIPGNL